MEWQDALNKLDTKKKKPEFRLSNNLAQTSVRPHLSWKINYTFPSLLKAPFCKQTGAIFITKVSHSDKWECITWETKRKLGPVNFCKDFWDCYWGQGKNWPIAEQRFQSQKSLRQLNQPSFLLVSKGVMWCVIVFCDQWGNTLPVAPTLLF